MSANNEEMGADALTEQEHEVLETLGKRSLSELRRVRALKKLQLEQIDLEVKFNDGINRLEKEFQRFYDDINIRRKAIVMGEYEPMDDECDVPLLQAGSEELIKKIEACAPPSQADQKGIPHFWLDTLLASELECYISTADAGILQHLTDITVELHAEDQGFNLLFHFAEGNPYIADRVLRKYYAMTIKVDPEAPFDYDGVSLKAVSADPINWFDGKKPENVIFFDWFDPAGMVYSRQMSDTDEYKMRVDFEIASHIVDSIIPKAVLYLTGEMVQDDDFLFGSDNSTNGSGQATNGDIAHGATKKLCAGNELGDDPMGD